MGQGSIQPEAPSRRRRMRRWPVALIALLAAARLLQVWTRESANRQAEVMDTLPVVFFSLVLLLGWWMFLSRLRWKTRFLGLAVVVLVGAFAAAGLRFEGFSGDVVPEFGWRWSGPAAPVPTSPEVSRGPEFAPLSIDPVFDQFRGSNRDGTVAGVELARDWSSAGPRRLWRQPVGAGWSGFVVAEGYAVTQEQRDDEEWITCYELLTGKLLWSHVDTVRFHDPIGGAGPRATPAIRDGRVYAVGGTGLLNCLELSTGDRIWSADTLSDHAAGVPEYGVSGSPLIVDDLVVVAPGGPEGSIAAYRVEDGERVWSGGSDPAGYSSPIRVDLAGVPQILIFNGSSVSSHDLADGAVLWSVPWPDQTQNVSQPVVLPGDRVFVSSGYGVGGKLFEIQGTASDGIEASLVWESRAMKAKFTNIVFGEGTLYGLDDGILAAVDAATGERLWKRGRYGHGQLLMVGDLLLILGEKGTVSLVEASPDAYHELASFQAIEGKTWSHPTLAGPYLLIRNDREAACYELPLAG